MTAGAPNANRDQLASDVAKSIRDGAQLALSLLATWAVALVVRVMIPRHLGPAAFGTFDFSDAFTATVVVIGSLGVDTYIRKEIPSRASHASTFFAGTIVIRILVGIVVMTGATLVLRAAGEPPLILHLVAILGAAQIVAQLNGSYGALLQSVGAVSAQSMANVVAKLVWGAGIVIAFAVGRGVVTIAAVMLFAELVRLAWLATLTRTKANLRYRLDLPTSFGVLFASFPYYVTQLAQTVYTRIDISIMAFMTSKLEVGWYGAAQNIAGLSLLLSPIIGWILLPLSSRVGERSREEMLHVFRRAMDALLAIAFPIALTLGLGADVITRLAFGEAFEPAARSLRLLAPAFVLTYITMLEASVLVRIDRGWVLTAIVLSTMVISPLLNVWLIPLGLSMYGAGGAGVGSSVAQLITEGYSVIAMTIVLRGHVFDRTTTVHLVKTTVAAGVVSGAHVVMAPLHGWRYPLDALLYLTIVIGWDAIDLRAWSTVIGNALHHRRAA